MTGHGMGVNQDTSPEATFETGNKDLEKIQKSKNHYLKSQDWVFKNQWKQILKRDRRRDQVTIRLYVLLPYHLQGLNNNTAYVFV